MSTRTITLTLWVNGGTATSDLEQADFITAPKSVIPDMQVFADAVTKYGFTENISSSKANEKFPEGGAWCAYKPRKGLTIEIPA